MPQKLKEVDVVCVGMGFGGSILAKELAASGLKVVGLERGKGRHSVPDFQSPQIHDELKYSVRKAFMQDVHKEAMTFRNTHFQEVVCSRGMKSAGIIENEILGHLTRVVRKHLSLHADDLDG